MSRKESSAEEGDPYKPRPFKIAVDSSFVEATRLKASNFRPTVDVDQPEWTEGPPSSEIVALAKYWSEEYDWFAVQSQLNANFSHFITTIPPAPASKYSYDVDVHFIHERSIRENAFPLLMLHGWPSTSLEWEKVIHPLAHPNDSSKPAFHVVAPDLPGYGFSPAPKGPGLGPAQLAATFASLMSQLGYQRFAIYSTDLGFAPALMLTRDYEDRIMNHITDSYLVNPASADMARFTAHKTSAEETAFIAAIVAFQNRHAAYAVAQTTLPLQLAHTLNDSPVGFMAWIYQLIHSVADNDYTPTELITQAFLLYLPGVYGNIRSYVELFPFFTELAEGKVAKSEVPTSVLQFGGEVEYKEIGAFPFVASRHSMPACIFLAGKDADYDTTAPHLR